MLRDNKNKPLFSIILPTYNRAFCIERAINSLLNQTFQDYQLIIVDDGSTDGTEDLIKDKYSQYLESKKFVYKHIEKSGVSIARNEGLKLAKTKWVGYLDSDNEMLPCFLEEFKKAIDENPKTKCFYAKFDKGTKIAGHEFDYKHLLKANYIDMGVYIHKKSVIYFCGGFDKKLKRLVDWDMIIRHTGRFTPVFIDKVLITYNDKRNYKRITNSENFKEAEERIYYKYSYTFLQKIFSIRKEKSHKVIRILGLKIKI